MAGLLHAKIMQMIKLVLSFIILTLAGLTWWLPQTKVQEVCSEPIAYTIGVFDRRFGMSQRDFLVVLTEAEAVWEDASGRSLFVYSPENARLSVNLIYDDRQAVTKELLEIENEVEENESTYLSLESRLQVMSTAYETRKELYEIRVIDLNNRNIIYQARVEEWNNGPRTSKKEFESLESERISINREADSLRVLESDLNRRVVEINALVDRLNRIARTLNLNVEAYNTIGAARGETFEGGVYYRDSDEAGINIYEFESREKLIRVLAHELGHALGLEHLDDPEAIMYHLNQDEATVATEADLAALENICKIN